MFNNNAGTYKLVLCIFNFEGKQTFYAFFSNWNVSLCTKPKINNEMKINKRLFFVYQHKSCTFNVQKIISMLKCI